MVLCQFLIERRHIRFLKKKILNHQNQISMMDVHQQLRLKEANYEEKKVEIKNDPPTGS